MASFVFQRLKLALAAGSVQWDDEALEVGLLLLDADGGFDPDPTIDDVDALAGEVAVTGYARQPVAGRTVERSDGDVLARWLADDVVFPSVGPGATVAGAVLYFGSGPTAWPGLYLPDPAGTLNGTDYTVAMDPLGILRFRDAG